MGQTGKEACVAMYWEYCNMSRAERLVFIKENVTTFLKIIQAVWKVKGQLRKGDMPYEFFKKKGIDVIKCEYERIFEDISLAQFGIGDVHVSFIYFDKINSVLWDYLVFFNKIKRGQWNCEKCRLSYC